MTADQQQPPAEDVHDYELPYGKRVPASYDATAAAELLDAHAFYSRRTGGGQLLPDDVVAMLGGVARVFARQFRDVREGAGQGEGE